MGYLPLEPDDRDWAGPHEGVPDWLFPSLYEWVADFIKASTTDTYLPLELIRIVQTRARVDLNVIALENASHGYRWSYFRQTLLDNREKLLVVINWLLQNPVIFRYIANRNAETHVGQLAVILREAGSVWEVTRVDPDRFRLTRRVEEALHAEVEGLLSIEDPATAHVRNAWVAAFGQSPNAIHAYDESIRAVEAIAQPIISPKDKKATLGKMIQALRDAPKKWIVALDTGDHSADVERLCGTMELLWKGHTGRHGTGNPDIRNAATPEEAEAAVSLAVLLVRWFRSGAVSAVS